MSPAALVLLVATKCLSVSCDARRARHQVPKEQPQPESFSNSERALRQAMVTAATHILGRPRKLVNG